MQCLSGIRKHEFWLEDQDVNHGDRHLKDFNTVKLIYHISFSVNMVINLEIGLIFNNNDLVVNKCYTGLVGC